MFCATLDQASLKERRL